jgi:hypothetical protein
MDAAYAVKSAAVSSWWWERIARLPRPGEGARAGGADPAGVVTP